MGELRRVKLNQGKIVQKRASERLFLQLPPGFLVNEKKKKKLQRKPAGTTCAVLSLPEVVLRSLHSGKRQSC